MYNRELAKERLNRFISESGLKVRAFAEKLCFSTSYVHMLCSGARPMTRSVAERIEEVFSDSGVCADFLLGAESELSLKLQKDIHRETTRILYEASRALENLLVKVESEYERLSRAEGSQPEDMKEEK